MLLVQYQYALDTLPPVTQETWSTMMMTMDDGWLDWIMDWIANANEQWKEVVTTIVMYMTRTAAQGLQRITNPCVGPRHCRDGAAPNERDMKSMRAHAWYGSVLPSLSLISRKNLYKNPCVHSWHHDHHWILSTTMEKAKDNYVELGSGTVGLSGFPPVWALQYWLKKCN